MASTRIPPSSDAQADAVPAANTAGFLANKARFRLFGLTLDGCIKVFFGGNAVVAVVVLTLITIFLFKEGGGFTAQNRANLEIYRRAGLEWVEFIRAQEQDHTALARQLADLRLRQFTNLTAGGRTPAEANAALTGFDDFADRFSDAIVPLRGLASDLSEVASGLKAKFAIAENRKIEREQLLAAGKTDDAAKVVISEIDFEAELKPILGTLPAYQAASAETAAKITAVLAAQVVLPTPALQERLEKFRRLATAYVAGFPAIEQNLRTWDYRRPVPFFRSITSFIFGRDWIPQSSWQEWYGILPLFVGSLMVSFVALLFAVPLGIGAAIYINQLASPAEQRIVKPCIEFISAIPSVVLGFFGVIFLGENLRLLSQQSWLAWVPGFPFSERLNILTAGCLLALIAVPTIFTLAEDALNNVPRSFKEASFALGASRLQTILRIIVPASLSGIISAVLLGLGRVIGETMVVLLCAGNRIAIPDFTAGLAVITQPVHTMTGLIAQEMGEVPMGSIGRHALFMIGLVLFFLSLLINWLAQKIVRRYRIAID
ncbi:MAG: phosphate ABC transporter permease subunit PstC [Verrucomicrobiota bacterium]